MIVKVEDKLHGLRWGEWILIGIFLLTIPLVNPYIRGDGNGYYAYICSMVIDKDLQFVNEYRRGDPAFVGMAFEDDGRLRSSLVMPTGYVRNQWAVGPSVLWAPFFMAAHGLVAIINELGSNIPADGYSPPYRWFCAFGTALYSFVGLILAYQIAKQFVPPLFAWLATMGIWFASSLPVYMYFLPFHVHALAAFSVSLFLWYWFRTRHERVMRQWCLWGLMAGLMVEIYYINAVFLLIPLGGWVWRFREGAEGARKRLVEGIVFGVTGLAALVPHIVIKWIIHGSPFDTGYREGFYWDSPRLWNVGFASEHGMFLWTPILLLAIVGLFLLWRRDRWLAGTLLITFAVFYYIIASYNNWHGLSSYGNRFFVSFTPIFILSLAIFLEKSRTFLLALFQSVSGKLSKESWGANIPRSASILLPSMLLVFLILWNIGFIFQWGTNIVPNRGPVDFTQVARNQITVVPHRLINFLIRYIPNREEVTREAEWEDLEELKDYRWRR